MGWCIVDEWGQEKESFSNRAYAVSALRWYPSGCSVVYKKEEDKTISNSDKDVSGGDVSGGDGSEIIIGGIIILFLLLRSCYLDREHVETIYYDSGNIKAEQTYINRKLNGPSRFYFDDSKTRIEKIQMYKDGKLNGVSEYYRENGTVERKVSFKNNKKNGMSKVYYPNGKVHTEAMMKNDKLDGISVLYDEKGHVLRKEKFINGKSTNIIE